MNTIPTQATGRDICGRDGCQRPIHLVNTQLGEEWVHDSTGFAWCNVRAFPASPPVARSSDTVIFMGAELRQPHDESATLSAERIEADAAPEPCDWGGCEREALAGAFCWFHAEEIERIRREQDREWWE